MQKQISDFIGKFLSPFLCGYRKGFSKQYTLLKLIERWKFCLDKQGLVGALLMDFSKAFDTINHKLLTADKLLITDGKESRSIQLSVLGLIYFKELHKDQFLVPYCLIFTMIYFLH